MNVTHRSPFLRRVSSVAQSMTQPSGGRGVTWKGGLPGVWGTVRLSSEAPPSAAAPPADVRRVWREELLPETPLQAGDGVFSCSRVVRTFDSSFRLRMLSSSRSSSYSSSAARLLLSPFSFSSSSPHFPLDPHLFLFLFFFFLIFFLL